VVASGAVPLRVLVIDDCADDAELVQIEFELQGVAARCHCVSNRAGAMEVLASFTPDAVLSDLNIPGWSGEEAFALVRERLPGVPFVLLSGAFREDRPLPDADAFLLKDDLPELPGLVRRLLAR
jgi:two-component system, OmpR family, response regulator